MVNPGRFITLEGGEGGGKTTQAWRLARRLAGKGIKAWVTREPGGTPVAETLRPLILHGLMEAASPGVEAFLFAAARVDHIAKKIRPALDRGDWVVCDRFADSTRAYQGASGVVSDDWITRLEDLTVGRTKPDITVILDVPVSVGLERVRARACRSAAPVDRFEAAAVDRHEAVRSIFLSIAARESWRCVVIDASGTARAEQTRSVWDRPGYRERVIASMRAAAANRPNSGRRAAMEAAAEAKRAARREGVAIPSWVPEPLVDQFWDVCGRRGEEAACARVRSALRTLRANMETRPRQQPESTDGALNEKD